VLDLQFDPAGNIDIVGCTPDSQFPQVNPLALANYPKPDNFTAFPFLATLGPDGSSLIQSTFLFGPAYLPSANLFGPWIRIAFPGGRLYVAGVPHSNAWIRKAHNSSSEAVCGLSATMHWAVAARPGSQGSLQHRVPREK
jgi:hypothetical protein